MGIVPTSGLALAALALTVLFGWLGARKAKPFAAPRLVPYRFFMAITFLGMLIMLVHLVTLLKHG